MLVPNSAFPPLPQTSPSPWPGSLQTRHGDSPIPSPFTVLLRTPCLCFCCEFPWGPGFSGWEDPSSGGRQGKKHLPSSRAPLGRGTAGVAARSQSPHTVIPQSSWCIYLFCFIFHCQACKQLWDLLGSPRSPPSFPSHHTGILWCFFFLRVYPDIFF